MRSILRNFKKRHYALVFRVKLLGCGNFCPNQACLIRTTSQNEIFLSSLCDKAIHRASRWELKIDHAPVGQQMHPLEKHTTPTACSYRFLSTSRGGYMDQEQTQDTAAHKTRQSTASPTICEETSCVVDRAITLIHPL